MAEPPLPNPVLDQGVLLVGAGGMLARAWRELLDRRGVPHVDVDLPQFDLAQPETIAPHVAPGVGLVINCAAWTDVDAAETQRDLALAINATGVGCLAQRCRQVGALLVHYSTDYVFDGQAAAPYPVDAPRRPIGHYGLTKARGEQAVEASGCRGLLIRTSWMYAPWGRNFVRTIARLSREKPALRVVADQRGRPTSAEHLAETSLALIERNLTGIWHVTDGGECTWFEFAHAIAAAVNPACRVEPCTTAEFPRPARRPAYSVLDLSRTEQLLGPMPPWRQNLGSVLQRIEP